MYGCATWTSTIYSSFQIPPKPGKPYMCKQRKRGYSFLYSVLQATELGGENGRASYRESLNLPTYQSERTSVKTNVMMKCAYLLLKQQL